MLEKVKKALECCSGDNTCRECPYYDYSAKCLSQLHKDVFEVMNNILDNCIREFAHFLTDSAKDGIIEVGNISDLAIEFLDVCHE